MPRMYTCAFILSLSLYLFSTVVHCLLFVACVRIYARRVCVLSFSSFSRIVDATIMQSILFFSLSLSFRLVSSLGSSVAACNVRTSPSSLPPPLVCIVSNAAGSRALSLREKSSSFSFSRANRDNIEETRQGNRCYTLLVRPLCRVDTFFPFNLR